MIGKNAFIQILSSSLSGLITFFTLSLSARLFGPEILGTLAYLFGLTGLIFAFSDLGFSRAHVHFTAVKQKISNTLGTFVPFKLGLLLFSGLLAMAIFSLSRQSSSCLLFIIVISYEVLSRFAAAILISFEALQQAIPQNLTRVTAKFVKLIAIILLAKAFKNSLGFSLTFLAEALILVLLALWLLRRFLPLAYSSALAKKYLHYSLPFFAIIPLSYLQDNSLVVILKRFWPATEVGYFSASAQLAGFIKTLFAAVMIFFFPKISALFAAKDIKSIQHYTNLAVRYLLILFVPVFLLAFLLRYELISLVLGPQFAPAAPIFSLFLLGMFLLMIFAPYGHVLFATKNHRPLVVVNSASLALTIILSFSLIPSLGAQGAVITSLTAWLVSGLWHLFLIKQRLRLTILPQFVGFAVSTGLALLLGLWAINYLQPGFVLKLSLSLLVSTVYLLILFGFKLITKQDIKYFANLIKTKLK